MKEQIATIDFETHPIQPRPDYPPMAVGLAVRMPGGQTAYHAWGHEAGGNNCTKIEAGRVVQHLWRNYTLLGHNLAFDLDVAEQMFHVERPSWDRIHDTMLLAFLHDPNSRELDLKRLAERHCGRDHTARDELREWIIANVPEAKRAKAQWGAHIWRAPAALAGRYAKADVRDTWALWRFYQPVLSAMGGAYDRERRLLPILMDMGAHGVPVNTDKLQQAKTDGEARVKRLERWLRRRLKAPKLETWTGDQLADAIEEAGLVCDEGWIATPSGKRSTSRANLPMAIADPALCAGLEARALISKQLSTFVEPWLRMATTTGKIYCQWNQVRSADGSNPFGARTGRISSSPNLQNVPVRVREFALPRSLRDVVPLDLRDCVEAPRGQRLFVEDFSQQELRLLAHFAGGPLLIGYQRDPRMDMHSFAQDLINRTLDSNYERWRIKNTGFGLIYGMGVGLLSKTIDASTTDAQLLKYAYLDALQLRDLDRQLKSQDHVVTWGGRICPVESPTEQPNGEFRSYEYKNLNTLIQGSAGDQLKQSMIDFSEKSEFPLILTVHDELAGLCPTKEARRQRKLLSECMSNQPGFQLSFPTDGAVGRTWRECK